MNVSVLWDIVSRALIEGHEGAVIGKFEITIAAAPLKYLAK